MHISLNTTILITGGSGFIGQHLFVKLIYLGYTNILGIDKKNDNQEDLSFYGKWSQKIKEFKPKIVIHLASGLSNDIIDNFKNNILASMQLFEVCKENKVEHIIFTSSAAVYGNKTEPINLYGSSKLWIEGLLKSYSFNHTILRLGNVYGPKGQGVINIWIKELKKRNSVLKINGDGKQLRDYIYVDDIVNSIIKAMEHSIFNVHNICTGRSVHLECVQDLLKKYNKFKTVTLPENKEEIKYCIMKPSKDFYLDNIRLEEGIDKLWNE